jgi:serine/threonine protein kinase
MSVSQTLVAGRYRLVRPLGRGGMGTVWLGRDEVLGRPVAVKEVVIPPALSEAEGDQAQRRSMREAQAAARLNHPNVVRMYDVVEAAGRPWIVMEYVPSRSLHDVVATQGRLPPEEVARIGLGVLAALRAAHSAGVLHRDVKPSNVLLTEDGRVVLTDFGLATVEDSDTTITRTGLILGSPAYIAPERAGDGTAGPASDLWSLGATLYAAVEGQSPFQRSSALATLAALATEEVPPAVHAGPLRPALEGLLHKDPEVRIGTDEAERRLRRAVRRAVPAAPVLPTLVLPPRPQPPPRTQPALPPQGEPPPRPQVPSGPRRPWRPGRERRPVALAVLAALAVVAVVSLAILRDSASQGQAGSPVAPSRPAGPSPSSGIGQPSATGSPTPGSLPPAEVPTELPAGWRWYHDQTGFTVAVPQGSVMSRDRTIVYFRDYATGRVLGIDRSPNPQWDPVADWTAQEQYRLQRGDWRDYHRIKIVPVNYHLAAADWEFTYAGNSGRIHVINRGFVASAHQAHAIYWSTPEATWVQNLPNFDLIASTFQPIPP